MPSRRPRHLKGEDAELWRQVTETVTPLRPRPRADPPPRAASDPPAPKRKAKAAAAASPAPKQQAEQQAAKAPPSLAPLDRRLTRRIARGARAVDAKVDLHGLTQVAAHARLLAFLTAARANGHRLVLVVTGKGHVDPAGEWWEEGMRGVLRRSVPEWLATPPFRVLVSGFERAHARKGGDGALYVQLRRQLRRPGLGGRETER